MKDDTELEKSDKQYIGEQMRALREKRKMTQTELAERMGGRYNRKHISTYEAGSDHMRMGTLFAVCEALEVPLSTLLPARLLSDTDKVVVLFYALSDENRSAAIRYLEYLRDTQKGKA